jgi:hypothetical protein
MLDLIQAPGVNRDGIDWLKFNSPIKINDFRGRLAVLAFWASESLPSLNTLSLLKEITHEFPNGSIVVGIDTPTVQGELTSTQLAKMLNLHRITIPNSQDLNLEISLTYRLNIPPSMVILDPQGRVVGTLPGEPDPDRLIPGISRIILDWQAGGMFTAGRA